MPTGSQIRFSGSDAARGTTSGRAAVARGIRGMIPAQTASGRVYPFKWFEGRNGSATRYGMKPIVAGLFAEARRIANAVDGTRGYWWDGEQGENVYMEISRRDDIGADLNAPSAARGGVSTASYALVPVVRPGDVVVHYDSREEAIVGVSVATGPPEPAPIYWVSRGSYARRAGEQARWLPGIRVPLGSYQELADPLTLAEVRAQRNAVLAVRKRVQVRARGQAIYFPWNPYQDTLRTFQSYLVKMPATAIALFPQLRAAVDRAEALSSLPLPRLPSSMPRRQSTSAAGKTARPRRGQGFQLDQAAKVAVEVHAMNVATEFYGESWTVEDVHGARATTWSAAAGTRRSAWKSRAPRPTGPR